MNVTSATKMWEFLSWVTVTTSTTRTPSEQTFARGGVWDVSPPTRQSPNLLTVILLAEVCRRFQDVLDECGVDLLHGQILDAVRVPVHVMPDALKGD